MEKVSCAKRIKFGLDVRGLKSADLCRMTGISKSTMSQYISGLYEPGQVKTELMARALHVDEAWLMGYDVPMEKVKPTPVSEGGPSEKAILLDTKLREAGLDLKNMSESDLQRAIAILKAAFQQ